MHTSCYCHHMANLQVRNIPEDVHERLRRHARESSSTMSAMVLSAIKRDLAMREWQKRLARRPETDLGVDAATLIAKERALRDAEVG